MINLHGSAVSIEVMNWSKKNPYKYLKKYHEWIRKVELLKVCVAYHIDHENHEEKDRHKRNNRRERKRVKNAEKSCDSKNWDSDICQILDEGCDSMCVSACWNAELSFYEAIQEKSDFPRDSEASCDRSEEKKSQQSCENWEKKKFSPCAFLSECTSCDRLHSERWKKSRREEYECSRHHQNQNEKKEVWKIHGRKLCANHTYFPMKSRNFT